MSYTEVSLAIKISITALIFFDFLVPFGRSQAREYHQPTISRSSHLDLPTYTTLSLNFQTFCGSYFPAPELLYGEPYTGPEVDVLVCGEVPFDH